MHITWLGHASFKIETNGKVIYIDPYAGEYSDKADAVLITQDHHDHFSKEILQKIVVDSTKVIAPASVVSEVGGTEIKKNEEVIIDELRIKAVAAYNMEKDYHPPETGVGYILTLEGKHVYHAGDTDLIPEMNAYDVDLALLPVGGTYTMDVEEAVAAVNVLEPEYAIPMHWGTIVGTEDDATLFKEEVEKNGHTEVKVLQPGDEFEY